MGIKCPKGLCHGCLKPLAPGTRSKYHDKCRPTHKYRTVNVGGVGGSRTLSRKESRRHSELLLLIQARQISELRTQVVFPLSVNGVVVAKYTADFVYRDEAGRVVVEDAKGYRTSYYRLKARLFAAVKGFAIREV